MSTTTEDLAVTKTTTTTTVNTTNFENDPNPFAKLSLGFMNPLFRLGSQRPLQQEDLGMVREDERVAEVYKRFLVAHARELELPPNKRSLWRALFATVGWWRPLLGIFLQGIGSGCGFAPPLILKALTRHFLGAQFFPNDQLSQTTLWALVCCLFVIPVSGTICSANSYVIFSHLASIVRNAIVPAVYKKALVLGSGAKATFSTGQVMNLFANDIQHVQNLIQNFAEPLFGIPQLAVALALIYGEMQVSMFVGLGLIVGVTPVMIVAILILTYNRNLKVLEGDLRIKLTNEVLAGIRILKYFSWEKAFERKIDEVREREMTYLTRMNMMMPIFIFCIMLIPIAMPVVMFYCYIALGNQLDPSKAFTVLSLFALIMTPVYLIPQLIQFVILAMKSVQRISDFLASNELPKYVQKEGGPLDGDVVISMEKASLSWLSEEEVKAAAEAEAAAKKETDARQDKMKKKGSPSSSDYQPVSTSEVVVSGASANANDVKDDVDVEMVHTSAADGGEHKDQSDGGDPAVSGPNRSVHTLIDISLSIRRGECVAVVGSVGSGKSSLLAGLMGELQPSAFAANPKASVHMQGTVAYHAQVPWILNATVRENILFGRPFDAERFEAALVASSLGPDIAMLPSGLETEIGERGINLSGGQKARVSFARTVYRDADLILLDDPLSAVDAHVGEHLFRVGIKKALKGKTVVLVTHQIHLIDDFDQVIIMHEGRIKAQGPPSLVKHLIDVASMGDGDAAHDDSSDNAASSAASSSSSASEAAGAGKKRSESNAKQPASESADSSSKDKSAAQKPTVKDGTLMTTEERKDGTVGFSVYAYFLDHGGWHWFIIMVLIAYSGSGLWAYSNFYLSDWGKQNVIHQLKGHPFTTAENVEYFNLYACYQMLYVVGGSLRTNAAIILGIMASRSMHKQLLKRILRADVDFFDTTPLGRIINRFSADVTQSDEKLGYTMGFFVGLTSNLLSIICSICVTTNGYFAIAIPPLLYLYYHVQLFFRKSNTELKRLENISRSPILTEFSQALQGATSLRAFGEADKYVHRMETSVDQNTTVNILLQIARWWLAIRLDVIGGSTSFFVAALCAGSPGTIPPEYLALALQQAFSMTTFLKNMVQMGSDIEAAMSSIERIKYYSEEVAIEEPLWRKEGSDGKATLAVTTDEEEDRIIAPHSPPADWPSKGVVEFKNVSMRYRDGPLVLNGLSASLSAKEKIGIAGRTGSGKSSLMVTLFRISPLESGAIFIDGIDISKLSLHSLRSRLGIVPQDPVMFSASLRYNLDPFSLYDDLTIWQVLESVQLKETVKALPGELEYLVSEGGENFSQGQRQLINLARVLLRNPRIIVLDEATASIDNETDQLISDMMRTRFQECTTLTIAHRLHTIIDSDKIMVLEKGKLIEMDAPPRLLEVKDGAFAGLWAQHLSSHNS